MATESFDFQGTGGGAIGDFFLVGWVTAPNTAGQSYTANTIQVATIDTIVKNVNTSVTALASNRATIKAGKWWLKAVLPFYQTGVQDGGAGVGIYNFSDTAYEIPISFAQTGTYGGQKVAAAEGEVVLASAKQLELRGHVVGGGTWTHNGYPAFTDTTSNAHMRGFLMGRKLD